VREPVVGDTIDGRYTLRREIARGGMGAVFEAEQKITGQVVALKLVHGEVGRLREAQERLLREARAITKVRHSGIVRVFDAGICPEAGPYLALEMLTGRTLDGILAARRALPIADAVHAVRQICDALAYVHARGVVHRDLKPNNVFVALEEGSEVVKIFDFGIAALSDRAGGRKLTQPAEVLGTPEYMAPEQLFCEPGLDHRSDVYAAGVTLYECLTGDVPYTGGYAQVIKQIAMRRKLPPLRMMRPEISPELDAVVAQAVAISPAERFQTATAFREALVGATGFASGATRLLAGGPSQRGADERPRLELVFEAEDDAADDERGGDEAADDDGDRPSDPIPLVRRNYVRAPYQTIVQVARPDGTTLRAQSEDISEGGLRIRPEQPVPEDEQVLVSFALPRTSRMVEAPARTRWGRTARTGQEHSVGLEFLELSEDARSTIADYVRLQAG
jgi:serine/threonine-protein kinase